MLIWSTAPLCWMVIGFSVGDLFGSIFLNTAIMGIADFIGNLFLMSVTQFFERQVLTSLTFLFLGLCLLTSSILRAFYYDSTRVADVTMNMFAKFFASSKHETINLKVINDNLSFLAAIAMTYLITSEVFPTVCRSTATGFSSTPGRIFMVFYSYIIQLGQDQIPWISPFFMGILSLLSAIASLGLPYTRNTVLLNTVEETEHHYRQKKTILAQTASKVCCGTSKVRDDTVVT